MIDGIKINLAESCYYDTKILNIAYIHANTLNPLIFIQALFIINNQSSKNTRVFSIYKNKISKHILLKVLVVITLLCLVESLSRIQ